MNDTSTTPEPVIQTVDMGKRYGLLQGQAQGQLRDRIGEAISRKGQARTREEKSKWALRHIDLEIPGSKIFGVIGRNGSGKTTLLSILAKVTAPTEGTATIRGRVVPLLQVGAGFHPQLTGRDNIALSGAIQGMTKEEVTDRVEDVIAFSEVGEYIDEPIKHYSSGMYARLAYSVAAFMPAQIMLIDEVLSVGDAAFRQKSEAHMRAALQDGRTVVYVGHGIDLVRELCENAVVLEAGSIVYRGAGNDAADYYEEEIVPRHVGKAGRARSAERG
jgi:lipopolysaccharide transport system ATP-binding protein